MTGTANAAAVKAAASITARISGRGTVAYVAAGHALTLTRRNPDGTAATATIPLHVDGPVGRVGGILPDDVLGRIVKARGSVEVTPEGNALRFASGGLNLGTTVPATDDGLQRVGWPHAALTSPYAVALEADYGGQGPEVARSAVEALQGVAEAAARGSDARAVLTAVVLDAEGLAVATDTYRLHVADLPLRGGDDTAHYPEALVPARVLQAIPAGKVQGFRLAAVAHDSPEGRHGWGMVVRLHYGGKANPVQVVIDANGPTVEGPYPRWRAIVPDLQHDDAWQAPIGTYVLPEGMPEAVKGLQANGPMSVTWHDGAGAVNLQPLDLALGSAAVTVPEGAPSATIGTATAGAAEVVLQAAYLAPASRFVGAGGTVQVRDPWKAVTMTGGGRTALVMPMRVNR